MEGAQQNQSSQPMPCNPINNFSNGVAGYGNPESTAWYINYLTDDLGLAKEMERNGRKLVETKHNWDRMIL
ncbi:MAG TPA: hypothetical protein ENF24_02025 [Methanosarcinales archaeon]|nr:hypothetical protein [Methanosarcinales archaeon]